MAASPEADTGDPGTTDSDTSVAGSSGSGNSYSGPVRILDITGNLLAIGTGEIEEDPEFHTWVGTIEVMAGGAVAGKALVVDLVFDGHQGRAQLIPTDNDGDSAHSRVVGLGPSPLLRTAS